MESINHINTITMQGRKYNLSIFSLIGGLGLIVAVIAPEIKAISIILIVPVIVGLIPAIADKFLKKKYSRNAEVKISDNFFSIKFFDLNGVYLNLESIIMFNELKYFKTVRGFYENTVLLELYLKSGTKFKCTFLKQDSRSESNVIAPFFMHIKNFDKSLGELRIGARYKLNS